MSRPAIVRLLLSLVTLAGTSGYSQTKSWSITPYGYGPVRAGMTVASASRALGVKLIPEGTPNEECYHVRPARNHQGLLLMVINHRIARASLYRRSTVKTIAGIGLGDTEQEVRRAYGKNIEITPHAYGGPADHYLTYWTSKERTHGIRYEVTGGKVDSIHGGSDSIVFVEGCS
jgi:hypothetical protein